MKRTSLIILLAFILAVALPSAALALEQSPSQYDFGEVDIQDVAPTMTWTVSSNYPGSPNNLGTVQVPTGFTASSNTCNGVNLIFGGSCTVKFSPVNSLANVGLLQGSATVSSQSDFSATLPLSARITRRVLSVDPVSQLDLGTAALGGAGKTSSVDLTNSGTGEVKITSIGLTGDVAALSVNVAGCVGVELGAHEKCSMPVSLHALSTGDFGTTLTVDSNDAAFGAPIQLSGAVQTPAGTVAPAALDFGSRSISAGPGQLQIATIANNGLVELSVEQPVLEGSGAAAFNVAFTNCAESLLPGAECKVALTFEPVVAGPASATLALATGDPSGDKHVALSGNGVEDLPQATTASGLTARFTGSTHLARATRLTYRFSCPANSCIVAGALKLKPSKGRALKFKAATAGALAGGRGTLTFDISKKQRRTIVNWLRAKRKVRATATLTDIMPGRSASVVVTKALRR